MGVVEPALGRALVLAAEAAEWETVALLAAELSRRRRAREARLVSGGAVAGLGQAGSRK